MKKLDYVIFGAGIIGEKVLIQYYNHYRITAFFDNHKEGDFQGYPIQKPFYKKETFIIVASNLYFEIRKQLLDMGYREFQDFVPYQIFGKNIAIAYGNCHIGAVKGYLERNKEFCEKYGIYPLPLIQNMFEELEIEKILSYCDLFIHQSIRKENRYGTKYASENMINYLPTSCKIVSIPNLYGLPKCFFPQIEVSTKKVGLFSFLSGDEINVEKWVQEGKTKQEIQAYMERGGVYTEDEILQMWKSFQEKLLVREEEWDIKISDYIFKHYKTKRLFYDLFHISDELVKEIAKRLLAHLGYEGAVLQDAPCKLDSGEVFLYRDVRDALGVEYEQEFIRIYAKNSSLTDKEMNLEEYVNQLYDYIVFKNQINNKKGGWI